MKKKLLIFKSLFFLTIFSSITQNIAADKISALGSMLINCIYASKNLSNIYRYKFGFSHEAKEICKTTAALQYQFLVDHDPQYKDLHGLGCPCENAKSNEMVTSVNFDELPDKFKQLYMQKQIEYTIANSFNVIAFLLFVSGFYVAYNNLYNKNSSRTFLVASTIAAIIALGNGIKDLCNYSIKRNIIGVIELFFSGNSIWKVIKG